MSDTLPLVSIIIPVYNAGAYVKNCLESILKQTYPNWEAICINDGSTDGSDAVLESFAERDSRIRVINQPNGGVSSARNRGLNACRAPYITMVDADDFLEADAVEKLLSAIQNNDCDLACCTMKKIFLNGDTESEVPAFSEGLHKADPSDIYRFAMRSPWAKIYKRDVIEKEHIRFPLNVPICEDDVFVVTYWSYAKSFFMLKEALYNYLQAESSVLKKLGEGALPYASYEATVSVPFLIYKNLITARNKRHDLLAWKSVLLKSQFHLLEWMCECSIDKNSKKRLRTKAKEYIKTLSSGIPWWRALLLRLRIKITRKLRRTLANLRR